MYKTYTYKELLDWAGKLCLGYRLSSREKILCTPSTPAVARKSLEGNPQGGYQTANALSRSEALKGMTSWAAYANFEEDFKGSIEVGKVADLVILSKDIMTVKESEILQAKVVATLMDGEVVYQQTTNSSFK